MPVQMDDAKVMERIAMLLAKAERTDNEHEAKTFSAAAEAMMLRYVLDEAAVEAARRAAGEKSKPDPIVKREITFTGGDAIMESGFRAVVVQAFGPRTLLISRKKNGRKDNAYRVLTVYGYEREVDRAMTIAESLRQQATTAMRHWEETDPTMQTLTRRRMGQTLRGERRSYLLAFASEAGQRIKENRRTVEAEAAGTGTALVLVDRSAAVDAAVRADHPKVKSQTIGVRPGAAEAGARDGRKARTGEQEVGGTRALGRN